jgi:hypothetical protein
LSADRYKAIALIRYGQVGVVSMKKAALRAALPQNSVLLPQPAAVVPGRPDLFEVRQQ